MNNEIQYISYQEALDVYRKTIQHSGGGDAGILKEGNIESILEFVQNDDYYPTFVEKLNYLVFAFCTGHTFSDGNKRVSITLGTYFLYKNGYYWASTQFLSRMEMIIYHVAAGHINKDQLLMFMGPVVRCEEFDESTKLLMAEILQLELYNDEE